MRNKCAINKRMSKKWKKKEMQQIKIKITITIIELHKNDELYINI